MRIEIEDDAREHPAVIFLGTEHDQRRVQGGWNNFDAAACNCFDARDKERMLAVMRGQAGGIRAFNSYVQEMVRDLFNNDLRNSFAPRVSCAVHDGASDDPLATGLYTGADDANAPPSQSPSSSSREVSGVLPSLPGTIPCCD